METDRSFNLTALAASVVTLLVGFVLAINVANIGGNLTVAAAITLAFAAAMVITGVTGLLRYGERVIFRH